tara:strand:+ start:1606 stop:1779 length:174 start_codon:yes stop_codon:yes gene_type:complete
MNIYFKKLDGEIFAYQVGKMSLEKCRNKFIECDINGNEIKKEKPKAKPKKKAKKEDK